MALATTELTKFVEELELAETPQEIEDLAAAGELEAQPLSVKAPDQPAADIDKGSLVSFVAGVSEQHQSDALNSTLLAQLNSDKKFDRFDPAQVINWYKNYTNVLSNVGWTMQDFQFQNYQASGSTFSINTAILELVSSFMSPAGVAVVKATLEGLAKLSDDDPWYQVFDTSSDSANGGNFQLGQCDDEGGTGPLVMSSTGFSFTTTEQATRFLWWEYSSSDTQLHYATQTATLDNDVYSQVRQQIIEKLGDKAHKFIAGLEI